MNPDSHKSSSEEERRHFLYSVATGVIAALVGLFPLITGLISLVSPWRRGTTIPKHYQSTSGTEPEGYLRICSLAAMPVGGTPQQFKVIGNRSDAWNFTASQDIGVVFVQRTAENRVNVFNATCPHAGCTVACDGQIFQCPCHNSSFDLDGKKRVSLSGRENPSPRSLDTLEVHVGKLAAGDVWIEFKNFYTGRVDKKPKA